MHKKTAALLFVLGCICTTETFAARQKNQAPPPQPKTYVCPTEIHIKADQADMDNAGSFTLWSDPQVKTPLTGISLYDGQPSGMAQLKPDNGDDPQAKEYTWTLYANPRGYWMVCTYSNTAERFTRQLNNPQKSCVTKTQDSVAVSLTCE